VTIHPPPRPGWRPSRTDFAGLEAWSPADCFRILYRRKSTLAWITGVGILVAILFSAAQPSMYRSETSLEIQGLNGNFLDLRDIYPTEAGTADASGAYVQTQAEILQQDALLEQVVQRLHLEQHPEFQRDPDPWDKFLRVFGPAAPPVPPLQKAVDVVKKNLEIISSRGSRVVRIVYRAGDPQIAAAVSNTLAQIFIEQSIETRQRAARQTRESLTRPLRDLNRQLLQAEADLRARSRDAGAGYATLRRNVDTNRQFYEAMARRVADASVASAVAQSNIRVVSPAEPAPAPYKPNLPLNLTIGMLGGLVVAVGSVMLREQTNSVLRAPGDAGVYLTLPELGAIPRAVNRSPGGRHSLLQSARGGLRVERAALEQRMSGVSESFRAILASILHSNSNGDHPRLFVVTSSRPMEGKTTVVSNLGIALAEISGRVLLIDGDMRRPRLHKVFDQANSWGLSDVLSEKNAIEDLKLDVLVKKTAIPHLYLLPSGACSDNIFGLLCSGRMARLLPRFRQEFDYVLVDAPPCLEFADARIMARYAEGLLLVVRADFTDKRTAQAAVQRLSSDGIPVTGVILNRWDPARSDLYGYGPDYGLDGQGLA
jgi:receptor protein-tyrosine kinase